MQSIVLARAGLFSSNQKIAMSSALTAAIFDFQGTTLSVDEKAFFRDANPFGYILFARHCTDADTVKRLVDDLKSLSGRDRLPILIDQEGGRVARLKPPHWPKYPPARVFAELAKKDKEKAHKAVYLNARLIAQDLYHLGITVNCAPLADLPVAGAHDIIGDRAFGTEAEQVVYLARAMAAGLMDGAIVPIVKHIPGHGRAFADSHDEVPVVDTSFETLQATDFVPFKMLANLPMAMTAHVLFTAIDPKHMATLSAEVIDIIRNDIGFKGLLISDALDMKSLASIPLDLRARSALDAGCDIAMHCNSSLAEKMLVAKGVSTLQGESLQRAERAMNSVKVPKHFDDIEGRRMLEELLSDSGDIHDIGHIHAGLVN